MKLPYRLAVLTALTTHLQGIHPGNGYRWDLRDKVFRGRNLLGDNDAKPSNLPLLSLLESPRPDLSIYTAEWASVRKDNWVLLLQGLVRDDMLDATDDAYWLVADVETHLARLIDIKPDRGTPKYPEEHLLGGLIGGLEIAPAIVRPPELGVSPVAFFYLPLRLELAVNLADPYAYG